LIGLYRLSGFISLRAAVFKAPHFQLDMRLASRTVRKAVAYLRDVTDLGSIERWIRIRHDILAV